MNMELNKVNHKILVDRLIKGETLYDVLGIGLSKNFECDIFYAIRLTNEGFEIEWKTDFGYIGETINIPWKGVLSDEDNYLCAYTGIIATTRSRIISEFINDVKDYSNVSEFIYNYKNKTMYNVL